jgi:hypothetical protein
MPRTPVTAHLLRHLLTAARIHGVALIHVAAVVEPNRSALMLHCGDGDAFNPATWQVPTGLALDPRDELTDVIDQVIAHTARRPPETMHNPSQTTLDVE